MSCPIQPTSTESVQEVVWPEYTPQSESRNFIGRLRRARIERGLSIPDMADLLGLGLRLAHEFENLITPLPFSHLSLWCQAVGVPFDDYLAIYWAEMEVVFEAQEREAIQNAPAHLEADATAAPALSRSPREFGFLDFLRAAVTNIAERLRLLFSTSEQTPK